jgi:hypothetical protein
VLPALPLAAAGAPALAVPRLAAEDALLATAAAPALPTAVLGLAVAALATLGAELGVATSVLGEVPVAGTAADPAAARLAPVATAGT